MSIKIKSTVAKIPTRQNGLAFLSRELIRLEIDFKSNTYQPFIEEVVFVEENEIITQIGDSVMIMPNKFTSEQVDAMFTALRNPINVADSFSDKLSELIENALLQETVNYNSDLWGISANEWVLCV